MGLADTLGFGKTASFQATVIVHELLQVPLLNAKFRIKWKFKGATHSLVQAGDDALAGAHHNHNSHAHHSHRHGFAERFLHPRAALSSSTSSHTTLPATPAPSRSSNGTDRDRTPSGSRARSRSPYAVYSSEDGDDVRSPTQSPPLSPDARPNRAGTSAFTFPSASTSASNGGGSGGGDTQTLYATPSNRTGTYDSGTTNFSPEGPDGGGGGGTSSSKRRGASDLSALASSQGGSGPGSAQPAAAHRPEPKGSTTFVPLRAHTAVFAREITCPVQVALRHVPGSSKYQLQPCPVRLAVHQEVPGEDGKREEERLGEVILDLSQFAAHPLKGGAEGVKDDVRPRRYLLQDCKSNAVLRVSVKMQWIDGEKLFVAPAFRTGQLQTGSSAAKGLDSGRNSPANRSSASIAHKANAASSTSSPTRLSGSNYARSTTSTTSVNRSNSTSSIGSLPGAPSPLSAASSIAAARSRPAGSHHRDRDHDAQGARGARPRKPKKVWHPSSTLSVSDTGFNFGGPPTTSSTHMGGGDGGDSVGGRGRVPVRSAADIVEGLFNRPLRRTDTDGTVTLSVASTTGGVGARDMHGGAQGGLGEPIELRHGGGGLSSGWKAHKARRSAAKSSAAAAAAEARLSGGEAAPASSSKAWSIRPRAREKHRDRDRAPGAPDASLPGFERTDTSATERVGRTPQEDVPQPTPATYAKVEAPAELHRQRERARWLKDVTHAEQGRHAPHPHPHEQVDVRVQPPTPQLLSSSHGASGGGATVGRPNLGPMRTPSSTSIASSVGSSSNKALSVQWGDRPSSTSSTPASAVSSSAKSTSSTKLGPRLGAGSSATAAAGGAEGERRLVPLRSQRSYDALGIARPASSASFSSLVTPPSPDRRDTAQRSASASGPVQGKEQARAPARRSGPGERAPGGAEWGRSWG